MDAEMKARRFAGREKWLWAYHNWWLIRPYFGGWVAFFRKKFVMWGEDNGDS